jgi:hypothetical protein
MRKVLAALAVLASTAVLPVVSLAGRVEAQDKLPTAGADGPGGSAMNNNINESSNYDLPQLARILADAYGNAVVHDTPNADPEAEDLLLESASVRFASRMVHEIIEGPCQRNERPSRESSASRACVLDDESVDLTALSDMLSYAAFRLEDLASSVPSSVATDGQRIFDMARIGSMAYLYRVIFALSRIHLDQSQSGVYLEAASDQLRLARKQMEVERSLCACDDRQYTARWLEMSELEDQLKTMRGDAAR